MNKRIIAATVLFCAVFVVAGVYIALTMRGSTADLDRLIQLHQVEILREKLLFRVKTVQSAIKSKNTRFFGGVDTTISKVLSMEAAVTQCFDCHHSGAAEMTLHALQVRIREYESAISRMLTVRANAERLAGEEDVAYREGELLIENVHEMIALTTRHLEEKTRVVSVRIQKTHYGLYSMLALGPLLAIGLAVAYLRLFAHPVGLLLEATRRLKAGDLAFRVGGLRHEFKEVGDSFNEMAQSLGEQMEKMQRAEQMAVCGTVAAGLAHEIKNPLAGISISLQVLGEELDLSLEDRDLFTKAKGEVTRIDTLVKGLLDFARPQTPEFQPVDVNQVLEKAIRLYADGARGGAGGRCHIEKILDPDLPQPVADPGQLLQVFLNLILNGIEAMPDGGTLSVRSRRAGEDLLVEVRDQGKGVPAELTGKIFEPFFTKKAKGTGLGLSISKSLVEQHGGEILVSNMPDGGASFTVRLPLHAREPSA